MLNEYIFKKPQLAVLQLPESIFNKKKWKLCLYSNEYNVNVKYASKLQMRKVAY